MGSWAHYSRAQRVPHRPSKKGMGPSRLPDPRDLPGLPFQPSVDPVLPFSLSRASEAVGHFRCAVPRRRRGRPGARLEATARSAPASQGQSSGGRSRGCKRRRRTRSSSPPSTGSATAPAPLPPCDMENTWNEADDGTQHCFGAASYTPYSDLLGCEMPEGQEATPFLDAQVSNNFTSDSPSTCKRAKKAKKGQGQGQSKGVAVRSSSYTPKEDEVMCSAFLNVSKDAIVSVNQPAKTYWERICDYYNDNRGMHGQRTISSLQHRWGAISRDTCKFTGFYAEIERKNQSGKNEDDKTKDALQLYNGVLGQSFKFIHCWFILRREQKWNELVAERKQHNKTRPEPSAEPVSPMPPPTAVGEINADPLVRPMGRDSAKKLRSANSSASSTGCLEVLQKIHSERAKYEERQEEQNKDESKEMAERYERKLRIQEESMNLQKHLLTKQVSIQERMLALQEKERVDKIMMADLDKLAPWVRDFYVMEQKEIAARRMQGGQPSDEN